jgi:hypothetical protein
LQNAIYILLDPSAMQLSSSVSVGLYAAIAVSSPVLFGIMAYQSRTDSHWIRCILVLLAIVGVPWGVLGILRVGFAEHFSRGARMSFDHFGHTLGGIAIGLLTSLALSPEFRQISRRRFSLGRDPKEPL